jgi:very-short-patch-repair endonuclease
MSAPVAALSWQLRATDAPAPVTEHRFHPVRKWRFDLAWPELLVAVEVDGGVWVQGRHTRGAGVENDAAKVSHAAALGWRVLRVTPRMIDTGEALSLVLAALGWHT